MNFYSAIVIKVCDLTMCRVFYRDVLGLGEPVTDSGFRTEFQLNPSCRLVLVKTESRDTTRDSGSNLSWCLVSENSDEIADRLATCGYAPKDYTPLQSDGVSDNAFAFRDPENNLFFVAHCQRK